MNPALLIGLAGVGGAVYLWTRTKPAQTGDEPTAAGTEGDSEQGTSTPVGAFSGADPVKESGEPVEERVIAPAPRSSLEAGPTADVATFTGAPVDSGLTSGVTPEPGAQVTTRTEAPSIIPALPSGNTAPASSPIFSSPTWRGLAEDTARPTQTLRQRIARAATPYY